MKNYKNFEVAISNFAPDLQSSYEDGLESLDRAIRLGHINKDDLIIEVEDAFSNPYFDWIEFVLQNKILYNDEEKPLTKEYAKEYIKSLVWNYLFGDNETKSVVS